MTKGLESIIKNLRKRNWISNVAMHVPFYLSYFTPLIEKFLEHDSLMFSEGDPKQMSARFLTGVGILAVGGLLKQYNDATKIDDVIKQDERKIVTNGLYEHVRHPCYLSQRMMALGWLTMFPTWYNAMAIGTYFTLSEFVARSEEKIGLIEFGEAYKKYMKKVPRWIPRIKPVIEKLKYLATPKPL